MYPHNKFIIINNFQTKNEKMLKMIINKKMSTVINNELKKETTLHKLFVQTN